MISRGFYRAPILAAVVGLNHEAETETRNRQRLRPGLDIPAEYPDPTWEVRVGHYRVLYARARTTGGVPHAVVHQEMLEDMERELRQMVRDSKGTARQAKQLLDALVIARDAGLTACDEIERELAERLRKPRAA